MGKLISNWNDFARFLIRKQGDLNLSQVINSFGNLGKP